jgi:hypothetical protein
MKAYLLFRERDFDFGSALPPGHQDLIQDLELTTLLQAMAAGDKFLYGVSARVLLACLADPHAIRYRQQVLADCLAQPEVIRQMYAVATAALEDRRQIWGSYGGSYQTPSSNLSGAVNTVDAYVARLRQLRHIADDHAGEFGSDGLRRLFATLQRDLDDEYFGEISDHLRQLRFRGGVLISAELDRDNSGINLVLRAPVTPGEAGRSGWGSVRARPTPSPWRRATRRAARSWPTSPAAESTSSPTRSPSPRITSAVTSPCCSPSWASTSAVSTLADRLAAKGVPISVPVPCPLSPEAFACTGLRDACLELRSTGPVVGNDVHADGKSLVIITGANSGGKSTFLRSVGVAQLMMQCGLFVTAGSYRANVTRGIFTHFIREEDAGMTSGRLDEELRRMSAIADRIGPRCLMLFNESFAGTNEREGSEIGRQVVSALMDAGITVFFVTHRFGFAEHFHRQQADSTLFLRAQRQPDGRRNYKLAVKDPLPTSYGEDLYYRLGGWLEEDRAPTSAATGR